MILYLAGGFHFSNKVENEKALGSHLIKKYGKYNRLATFFYNKDALNIQQSVDELKEETNEDKGTVGSNTKGNARRRR